MYHTLKFPERLVNAHLMLSLSLLYHHQSSAVFHAPIIKRRQCNAMQKKKRKKKGNMLAEMPSKSQTPISMHRSLAVVKEKSFNHPS
jgi:hypothetical protein